MLFIQSLPPWIAVVVPLVFVVVALTFRKRDGGD